jgi:hypothetical protein
LCRRSGIPIFICDNIWKAEIFKSYRENPYAEDKNNKKYESSEFLHWMKEISARYVGLEKADRYARRIALKEQHYIELDPKK